MNWFLSKASSYLKGWFLTYLAIIVFFALDWMRTGVNWDHKLLLVPAYMACVIWTILFLLGSLIALAGALFTFCTAGLGILLVFPFLAYGALCFTRYLLPEIRLSFDDSWFEYSAEGIIFAIINASSGVIVRIKTKANGKRNNKEKPPENSATLKRDTGPDRGSVTIDI